MANVPFPHSSSHPSGLRMAMFYVLMAALAIAIAVPAAIATVGAQ